MCGIYGYAGIAVDSSWFLENGLNKLIHRGPDGLGQYTYQDFGISMCRLAINEIQTGTQPFTSKNQRYSVVFNGEIYNYKEITKLLELPSHTSEAEVIVELFTRQGIDFINLLDGMFAIALLDSLEQKLYLFRDPFGKKPLWILTNSDGSIEFASEIKAFQSKKNLRDGFVSDYLLYGYIPFNKSTYMEVQSLPPGSMAIWSGNHLEITPYFSNWFEAKLDISYHDAISETDRLLRKAISKRLISERPIGVFLSGGYDSSLVAALMKQEHESQVNSYTIGFRDIAFNEAEYAKEIADYLGLVHHEEYLQFNVVDTLQEVYRKIDQPFADSSIVPTYLLNKFASKEIVVALAGDGGDEIFAGYDRYLITPLIAKYGQIMRLLPKQLPTILNQASQINRKLERLHQEMQIGGNFANCYTTLMTLAKPELLKEIVLLKELNLSAFDCYLEDFNRNSGSKLRKMIISDLNNYLPGDLLVKADLASMFNGVEVRSPFLDKELATFAARLPDKYLLKGYTTKRLLKDLSYQYIPKKLLNRPKMGFGVPMDLWLRNELRILSEAQLLDSNSKIFQWLDSKKVKNLFSRHQKGENLSRVIWPILALALWIDNSI